MSRIQIKTSQPEAEGQDVEQLGHEAEGKVTQMRSAFPPNENPDDPNPQDAANNSPRVLQLKAMATAANQSPQVVIQRQRQEAIAPDAPKLGPDDPIIQELAPPPIQLMASDAGSNPGGDPAGSGENNAGSSGADPSGRDNKTGLPMQLKQNAESMSGYSMDDVRVHYNSDKPMQLQAHAYAQGSDIHLGPGQEQHLPHEAWHVVQQKQGRVAANTQLKGIGINDDSALEREADVMGAKMMSLTPTDAGPLQMKKINDGVAQRVVVQIIPDWDQLDSVMTLDDKSKDEVINGKKKNDKKAKGKKGGGGSDISGIDDPKKDSKDNDGDLKMGGKDAPKSAKKPVLPESKPALGGAENDDDKDMKDLEKKVSKPKSDKQEMSDDDDEDTLIAENSDNKEIKVDAKYSGLAKGYGELLTEVEDDRKMRSTKFQDGRYRGMLIKEILIECRPDNLFGPSAGDHTTAFGVYAQGFRVGLKGATLEKAVEKALEMFGNIGAQEAGRKPSKSESNYDKIHRERREETLPRVQASLKRAVAILKDPISIKRDRLLIPVVQNAIAGLMELQELTPLAAVNTRAINASEAGKGKGESHRINYLQYIEDILKKNEVLNLSEQVECVNAAMDLFDFDSVTKALMEKPERYPEVFSGSQGFNAKMLRDALAQRHKAAITQTFEKVGALVYGKLKGDLEFENRFQKEVKAAIDNKLDSIWLKIQGTKKRKTITDLTGTEIRKDKREAKENKRKEKKKKLGDGGKLDRFEETGVELSSLKQEFIDLEKTGSGLGVPKREFKVMLSNNLRDDATVRDSRRITGRYQKSATDFSHFDDKNDEVRDEEVIDSESVAYNPRKDRGASAPTNSVFRSSKLVSEENNSDKTAVEKGQNKLLKNFISTDRNANAVKTGKKTIEDVLGYDLSQIHMMDSEQVVDTGLKYQSPYRSGGDSTQKLKSFHPKSPFKTKSDLTEIRKNYRDSKKDHRTKPGKVDNRKALNKQHNGFKVGSATQLNFDKDGKISSVEFGERPASPLPNGMGAHSTAWIVHQSVVKKVLIGKTAKQAMAVMKGRFATAYSRWEKRDKAEMPQIELPDQAAAECEKYLYEFEHSVERYKDSKEIDTTKGPQRESILPGAALSQYISSYLQFINFMPGAVYDVANTDGRGEGRVYRNLDALVKVINQKEAPEKEKSGSGTTNNSDNSDTVSSMDVDAESKPLTNEELPVFIDKIKAKLFELMDGLMDMNEDQLKLVNILVEDHFDTILDLFEGLGGSIVAGLKKEYTEGFLTRNTHISVKDEKKKKKKKGGKPNKSKKNNKKDDDGDDFNPDPEDEYEDDHDYESDDAGGGQGGRKHGGGGGGYSRDSNHNKGKGGRYRKKPTMADRYMAFMQEAGIDPEYYPDEEQIKAMYSQEREYKRHQRGYQQNDDPANDDIKEGYYYISEDEQEEDYGMNMDQGKSKSNYSTPWAEKTKENPFNPDLISMAFDMDTSGFVEHSKDVDHLYNASGPMEDPMSADEEQTNAQDTITSTPMPMSMGGNGQQNFSNNNNNNNNGNFNQSGPHSSGGNMMMGPSAVGGGFGGGGFTGNQNQDQNGGDDNDFSMFSNNNNNTSINSNGMDIVDFDDDNDNGQQQQVNNNNNGQQMNTNPAPVNNMGGGPMHGAPNNNMGGGHNHGANNNQWGGNNGNASRLTRLLENFTDDTLNFNNMSIPIKKGMNTIYCWNNSINDFSPIGSYNGDNIQLFSTFTNSFRNN